MATPNQYLIAAIRKAAGKISESRDYQWGHMGKCNCGFLARELTNRTKEEIHQSAMRKCGDWSEQVLDYCPSSGFLMDEMISIMLEAGLERSDLIALEKLSSQDVLKQIPVGRMPLFKSRKEDVVLYMETWARLLEARLEKELACTDISEAIIPNKAAFNLQKAEKMFECTLLSTE